MTASSPQDDSNDFKRMCELGVVACTCDPSTWEAEAGES
jgi:hypothetical protein